jgi:acyl carrier protein
MSTNLPDAVTETELKLVDIWQAVLGITAIRVTDEFLDLGGDSLSAMMCISRVRREFDCELTIEDFFLDDATIARFASLIDSVN